MGRRPRLKDTQSQDRQPPGALPGDNLQIDTIFKNTTAPERELAGPCVVWVRGQDLNL
jgi:hypothetical protein